MIKQILDFISALILLVLTFPLMILVGILIRLDSAGPAIFSQKRVGKNEKEFTVFKFRTMVEGADEIGPIVALDNDPRVTQIGMLLRLTKIDRLPQLVNILKGEMSLVGPMAELPEIVKHYSKDQKRIFSVKPGVLKPYTSFEHLKSMDYTEEEARKHYLEEILPKKIQNEFLYLDSRNPFKDINVMLGGSRSIISSSIKLRYVLESRRRFMFFIFDLFVCLACYWFAFFLRFEGKIPEGHFHLLITMLPAVALIRGPCFVYFGLYQSLWQYLGIQELLAIIKAATVGTILLPFVPFLIHLDFQPRSTIFIDWILLIVALGGSRVIFKITAERLRGPKHGDRKKLLIVGAEDLGELLVREYIKHPELGYQPIGFVDNDLDKLGMRIHGVKVLGKVSQLAQVIHVKKVDEVVIALSEASGEQIRTIIKDCRALNLPCRIVPPTSKLLSPQALPLKLRPVDVSDLLGRELASADIDQIRKYMSGKRVLVTGAGGSIGSELTRIIYQSNPDELILIDNSESSLYDIETDLQAQPSNTVIHPYLRDITKYEEMEKVVSFHNPDIIYHAAAYKHVPLLENHYRIGILNNIVGTKTMADLADKYKAEKFVLISTDKAINPSSLMGATKRISELYIEQMAQKSKTRYMAVRFGNVFNSKGSVVPLFKKQIERGGPVTVTDEDVTRYFMDISEAVFLILQASILGKGSEIFVLDMGKPVRIVDLARNLIQLMGMTEETIPIRFMGLRPGEKLEEEIEFKNEESVATKHKKICVWKSKVKATSSLEKQVEDLFKLVNENKSREDVIKKVIEIVPEYHPWQPPV